MMRKLFIAATMLCSVVGMAQTKPTTPTMPSMPAGAGSNPLAGLAGLMGGMGQKTGPKPYKEVITDKAVTDKGLFTVHKVDDRFYFELPDSLLNRQILVVNRIVKSPAGVRVGGFLGYAGDQIGENVITFEKGPNNRIFLRNISLVEMASDSSQGMYRAVMNSNIQPITASFDVKAFSKDSTGTVVDITDYISGDNDVLFFDGQIKSALRVGGLQNDKSFVNTVKSYPMNIEIRTTKTYSKGGAGGFGGISIPGLSAPSGGTITFELNSSMVLLPKNPVKARLRDDRVGYFSTGYTDFDANPQGVKRVSMITRWKLEPKPEDVEKYKKGILVEPAKPIVYYIDPATPAKWVPYLIQGVNDWQSAFEKAGFKNAIVAKKAPTMAEDSTWSIEDARYSAIVYKPSETPNASGPHVHDPRSGEIIESHINWYHNVMSLLRNWYFIQTAAVDPRARKMVFDDELMGQLIRFVSSHEVGHTLGLQHNFGSSSTVPVEKLRDKAWVEANGHTPSIMDYARFNYVAQPEDNISEKGLFPRIGEYDNWAIEWGYRWMPEFKTADDETPALNKMVSEKLKDKKYWYGLQGDQNDPRANNEDLSDNAMKAGSYGIKNLQRILPNLKEWTKQPNEDYDLLGELYREVTGQFSRYMGHVSKNIGGIYYTPKTREQEGAVYEWTPKATQKDAVAFLQQQLFTTPTWLISKDVMSLSGSNPLSTIASLQNATLGNVLGVNTLSKLARWEAEAPTEAYALNEYVGDLKKGIFSELAAKKKIDAYRRALQKNYVQKLIDLLSPAAPPQTLNLGGQTLTLSAPSLSASSDVTSVIKAHAKDIAREAKAAAATYPDVASKQHLQDIADRLEIALNPKK
jgi:Met-zincin/Domain of unknown function (DUF5117)/Domain of unknown function (DUF5118)